MLRTLFRRETALIFASLLLAGTAFAAGGGVGGGGGYRGGARTSVNCCSGGGYYDGSTQYTNYTPYVGGMTTDPGAGASESPDRNVREMGSTSGPGGSGCCYSPPAPGAAAAAGTPAVVGSVVTADAMPSVCISKEINGVDYEQCGASWYQPQFSGTNVTYLVVNHP